MKQFLTFGHGCAARARRHRIFQPRVEGLTTRLLPSGVTATLTNGVLSIDGTSAPNAVKVTTAYSQNTPAVFVQVTGQQSFRPFALKKINSIVVNLKGGDDSFTLSDPAIGTGISRTLLPAGLPVKVNGGAGDDSIIVYDGTPFTLTTKARAIFDGGPDNDLLIGGAGNDIIRGGSGDDVIVGQRGNDQLYGDDGDDDIWDRQGLGDFPSGFDVMDGGTGTDQVLNLESGLKQPLANVENVVQYPVIFIPYFKPHSSPSDPPRSPSNLRATNIQAHTVDLAWNDNSSNETEFRVAISRDGGATWDNAAVVGANVTSFRVTGLLAGRRYLFKVRAANAAGYSDYSPTLNVTT